MIQFEDMSLSCINITRKQTRGIIHALLRGRRMTSLAIKQRFQCENVKSRMWEVRQYLDVLGLKLADRPNKPGYAPLVKTRSGKRVAVYYIVK